MGARFDAQQAAGASIRSLIVVDPGPERGRARPVCGPDTIALHPLADTVTMLSAQLTTLQARNRELVAAVQQLRDERRQLRLHLARDLHDGVQNEFVSMLARLARAEHDPDVPPALARTFAALADHATAALASLREITNGIYPRVLAKSGVLDALRECAARASVDLRATGPVPHSSEDAEAAIYFSCCEAIQNIQKHAGRAARASLSLHHHDGVLTARIEDDGRGFNPARTPRGAGLRNIHDRVHALGGALKLDSGPGRGTVLTISLPWPTRS